MIPDEGDDTSSRSAGEKGIRGEPTAERTSGLHGDPHRIGRDPSGLASELRARLSEEFGLE